MARAAGQICFCRSHRQSTLRNTTRKPNICRHCPTPAKLAGTTSCTKKRAIMAIFDYSAQRSNCGLKTCGQILSCDLGVTTQRRADLKAEHLSPGIELALYVSQPPARRRGLSLVRHCNVKENPPCYNQPAPQQNLSLARKPIRPFIRRRIGHKPLRAIL